MAEPWKGVNYRLSFFEFGTYRGHFNYASPGREGQNVRLNQNYLGTYLPLGWLGVGKRRLGTHGLLLLPFVSGGVGHTTYRPSRVQSGPSKYGVAHLYAAPGLSLQVPYFTIDLRAQSTYYFANKDYADAPYRRGWSFTPVLSLQFDLLSDVFNPRMSSIASASGYAPKSQWSSSGNYAVRTTTYSRASVDVSVMDVGPFVALAPRYTWSRHALYRSGTMLPGLGVSARLHLLALDGWVDYGQRGVASSFETLATLDTPEPKERKVNEHDDQFAGYRRGGRIMARAGVDVYPAIKTAFLLFGAFGDAGGAAIQDRHGNTIVEGTQAQLDPGSRIDASGSTSFFRVILGLGGGGYANQGPLTYLHPEQEVNLDRKFGPGNPGKFAQNKFTDPRLAKAGAALQAYVSIEAGCASLSFERTSYTGDPLAKESTVAVAWLLPVKRLREAHRALRAAPKAD